MQQGVIPSQRIFLLRHLSQACAIRLWALVPTLITFIGSIPGMVAVHSDIVLYLLMNTDAVSRRCLLVADGDEFGVARSWDLSNDASDNLVCSGWSNETTTTLWGTGRF